MKGSVVGREAEFKGGQPERWMRDLRVDSEKYDFLQMRPIPSVSVVPLLPFLNVIIPSGDGEIALSAGFVAKLKQTTCWTETARTHKQPVERMSVMRLEVRAIHLSRRRVHAKASKCDICKLGIRCCCAEQGGPGAGALREQEQSGQAGKSAALARVGSRLAMQCAGARSHKMKLQSGYKWKAEVQFLHLKQNMGGKQRLAPASAGKSHGHATLQSYGAFDSQGIISFCV